VSCAETAEPIDLPLGCGRGQAEFNRIRQVAPMCSKGRFHSLCGIPGRPGNGSPEINSLPR